MPDLTNIRYANKNYKLICRKYPNINYKTRQCSYVILIEDKCGCRNCSCKDTSD